MNQPIVFTFYIQSHHPTPDGTEVRTTSDTSGFPRVTKASHRGPPPHKAHLQCEEELEVAATPRPLSSGPPRAKEGEERHVIRHVVYQCGLGPSSVRSGVLASSHWAKKLIQTQTDDYDLKNNHIRIKPTSYAITFKSDS